MVLDTIMLDKQADNGMSLRDFYFPFFFSHKISSANSSSFRNRDYIIELIKSCNRAKENSQITEQQYLGLMKLASSLYIESVLNDSLNKFFKKKFFKEQSFF